MILPTRLIKDNDSFFIIIPLFSIFVQLRRAVNVLLCSNAAKRFLALYTGGMNENLLAAYMRIWFWKFSNSAVLLKSDIAQPLYNTVLWGSKLKFL